MMIILSQTSQGEILTFSPADADLSEFLWTKNKNGYLCRGLPGNKTVFLHRLVAERMIGRTLSKDEHVDHIDRNTLNNRRENLRIVTRSQNMHNRTKQRNNTSGYKGVSSDGNRWCASIMCHGKTMHLGVFATPQEAAQAYNNAASLYHGVYARLNEL